MAIYLSDLYQLVRRLRAIIGEEFEAGSGDSAMPAYVPIVLEQALHAPGCPIQDIVRATHLTQSVVSKAVSLAQERGWLVTKPDPRDARRSLVHPTKSLQGAIQIATSRTADEVLRPILEEMPISDQKLVLRGLELLVRASAARRR